MKIEITKTAVRTKEGDDWTAYFFKHRNNTVMVEDMWHAINDKNTATEVIAKLIEMQNGYGKVKRTVEVSQFSPVVTEVVRWGNLLPSITINIKQ